MYIRKKFATDISDGYNLRKEVHDMVTELNIIINTLEDPSFNIHRIEFEQNYYTIRIIYNGDYIDDKAKNNIKRKNFKILAKSKNPLYAPAIGYANGNVTMKLPGVTLFDSSDLKRFDENYNAACKTIVQIENEIKKII